MDVWYVGYGSNLFRERFIYYITGGQFPRGGSYATGCSDKTLPGEDKPFIIPHGLFFAKSSGSWDNGGVAFIFPERDETKKTYGRMWKITAEQFLEIWDQEGMGLYNISLYLGKDEQGIPIITITNNDKLTPKKPSDEYVRTIVAGLKETYHLRNETISKYLIEKAGIKDNLKEKKIIDIINSADETSQSNEKRKSGSSSTYI